MEVAVQDLRIICYPDPQLRKKCRKVDTFDAQLASVAERMFEIMREAKGVGLAATQVGMDWQLFVCNHTGEPENDLVVINPKLDRLVGGEVGDEGCLSIPNVTLPVRRAEECRLQAQNLKGESFAIEVADLRARIWQHETDHLNGRLIIDYMGPTEKITNRRAMKELEDKFR